MEDARRTRDTVWKGFSCFEEFAPISSPLDTFSRLIRTDIKRVLACPAAVQQPSERLPYDIFARPGGRSERSQNNQCLVLSAGPVSVDTRGALPVAAPQQRGDKMATATHCACARTAARN